MNAANLPMLAIALLCTLAQPAMAFDLSQADAFDAAVEHRLLGDSLDDPAAVRASYEAAVASWRAVLAADPANHTARWYLADTLFLLQDYDAATVEYIRLSAPGADHAYHDGVAYQLMRTSHDRLEAKHGTVFEVPPGTQVTGTLPNDTPVYALSTGHLQYIDAADRLLTRRFADTPDNVYAEAVDQNRPAIAYLAAQVLFHHHHLPAARERLSDIIQDHPDSVEASYSATLLVDSYILVGDLHMVRLLARRFLIFPPGPKPPTVALADTVEGASFKLCLEDLDRKERAAAKVCFLDYLVAFPASEHAALALYNAAYSAALIDDPAAAELWARFLADYPEHELAPGARQAAGQ